MSRTFQDITIGGSTPADSFLHRLDPRTKLLGVILTALAAFLAPQGCAIACPTVVVCAAIRFSGIRGMIWLRGLYRFRWMLAIVVVAHLAANPWGVPVVIGSLELPFGTEGLESALLFASRLALLIAASMLLTFSTSPRDIAGACKRFAMPLKHVGVPVEELGLILLLAIRFVPVLQMEIGTVVEAQQARGIRLGKGGLVARASTLTAVLVPALLAALRRSELLASAMAARGFVPGRPRSEYKSMRFSSRDWMVMAGLALFFVCCMAVFG